MLESGLVLDAFYTPKDTGGKTKIQAGRRYILLVLHPRIAPRGKDTKYMHALVLDSMPVPVFERFAKDIGVEYSEKFKKVKKLKIPKFDMDKDEAKTFYLTEVKNKLKTMAGFEDCYRTFLYDNFSRIFVTDYNFKFFKG